MRCQPLVQLSQRRTNPERNRLPTVVQSSIWARAQIAGANSRVQGVWGLLAVACAISFGLVLL